MTQTAPLTFAPEVRGALDRGMPVVALESTIITHGMPYPGNLHMAESVEAIIRTPIKDLLAGLDPDEFWQVHRGVVVRVSAIDRVRKDEFGKSTLQLRGRDDALPVSAAFLHRFRGM